MPESVVMDDALGMLLLIAAVRLDWVVEALWVALGLLALTLVFIRNLFGRSEWLGWLGIGLAGPAEGLGVVDLAREQVAHGWCGFPHGVSLLGESSVRLGA